MALNIKKVGSFLKVETTGEADEYILMSSTNIRFIQPSAGTQHIIVVMAGKQYRLNAITDLSVAGVAVSTQADFDTKIAAAFPEANTGSSGSGYPNRINVKDYGAVGDGTNATTAFNNAVTAAAAAGKDIWVPKGTYLLGGVAAGAYGVQLPDNVGVYGEPGAIISVVANRRAFMIGENSIIDGLKFTGSGKTNNQTFEGGILLYNDCQWQVRNCWFDGFSGANTANGGGCIIVGATNGPQTYWKNGGQIINCFATNSAVGINFDAGGEYVTVIGSKFTYNTTGVSLRSGNVKFIGCNIDDNTTGLLQTAGSNDGHGGFVECTFNHNTTPFSITGITQGHRFTSCAFYAGNASITSSVGIRFVNCDFSGGGAAMAITLTTSTNLIRAFCRTPASGASTVTWTGTGMTAVNDLDF